VAKTPVALPLQQTLRTDNLKKNGKTLCSARANETKLPLLPQWNQLQAASHLDSQGFAGAAALKSAAAGSVWSGKNVIP
jgi:hypothetical protein